MATRKRSPRALPAAALTTLLLLTAAPALAGPPAHPTPLFTQPRPGELAPCANPLTARLVETDERFSDGSVGQWYYYPGRAGERVLITMNSSLLDTIVFLYGPDGRQVAKDDDGGGDYNARLEFTLPVDGTYKLLATTTVPGAAQRPNEEIYGDFELKLLSDRVGEANPAAASAATPAPPAVSAFDRRAGLAFSTELSTRDQDGQTVRVANPARGTLTESDQRFSDGSVGDWYTCAGAAGEKLVITMNAPGLDSIVFLYRATGDEAIAQDDDGGGDWQARLEFTLPAAGTYRILATTTVPGAEGRPNQEIYGDYELAVFSDYPAARAGTVPAAPIGSGADRPDFNLATDLLTKTGTGEMVGCANPKTAALAAGDPSYPDGTVGDDYWYQGVVGEQVIITMMSPTLDTMLHLFAPDGSEVARDDDSAGEYHARLTATLPADGRYRILATTPGLATDGRGNQEIYGSYELTILSDYEGYRGNGGAARPPATTRPTGNATGATGHGPF